MTGEGGRLPVVLPPDTDERLSSWLARLAVFYAMSVPEFLAKLGLKGRNVFDLEWRLSEGEGVKIVGRTGLSENKLQAMTFREIVPEARIMIARKGRHHCPLCPVDVQRKTAAFPWTFRCPVHGVYYRTTNGATLAEMFAGEQLLFLAPMPRQVQAFWPLGRGAKSRATWGRLKCLHS